MYNTQYSTNYDSRNPRYWKALSKLKEDRLDEFEHLMTTGKLLYPPKKPKSKPYDKGNYVPSSERQWNSDATIMVLGSRMTGVNQSIKVKGIQKRQHKARVARGRLEAPPLKKEKWEKGNIG